MIMMIPRSSSSIGNMKVSQSQGSNELQNAMAKRISTRIRFKNKLKAASKPKPYQPLIDDQGLLSEMELEARSLYPGSSAHKIIFLNILGLTPTSSSSYAQVTDHINKIRDEVVRRQIKPVESITVTICRSKKSRKITIDSARTSGARSSSSSRVIGVDVNVADDDRDHVEHFKVTSVQSKQTSESGYDSSSSSPSPPATAIDQSSSSSSSSTASSSSSSSGDTNNKRRLLYTQRRDGSYNRFCGSQLQSQSQAVQNNEADAFDVNYLRGIAKHLLLLGTELDFV